MQYVRAGLAEPPKRLFLQWGDLPLGLEDWVQPPETWRLILYAHDGVARINGRSYPYVRGTGLVFPPYASCGHAKVGAPSLEVSAHFDLPETDEKAVALPIEFPYRPEWYDQLWFAGEHGMSGAERGKALVWHILWTISEPATKLRNQSRIYDAEDLIRSMMAEKFSVAELAARLDVSQSTLLNWFQAEHNTTIQGFIRQTRAREASRLLTSTDLPIKTIASRVGVSDLQQFNKLIRQHCGLSPREYRLRSS